MEVQRTYNTPNWMVMHVQHGYLGPHVNPMTKESNASTLEHQWSSTSLLVTTALIHKVSCTYPILFGASWSINGPSISLSATTSSHHKHVLKLSYPWCPTWWPSISLSTTTYSHHKHILDLSDPIWKYLAHHSSPLSTLMTNMSCSYPIPLHGYLDHVPPPSTT